MNIRNRLISGLAALALAFAPLAVAPAAAGTPQALMCQGDVSGASTGARTIGGTNSQVPSGTLYVLNSNGCALIAQADIGYFQSQGYVQNPSQNSAFLITGTLPASGTADIVGPVIPAGAYIQQIIWSNTTANAVTGGMSVGTTANGTDVVAAQALGANALTFTTDALLLKRVFSLTAATTLHFAPVTSSNSAALNITVVYAYF
jgi:hypothetical protein